VVETTISRSSGVGSSNQGGHTIEETDTTELKVMVTDGVDESGTDAHSSLRGRAEGRFQRRKTFTRWYLSSCGPIVNRKMNESGSDSWNGSAGGASTITVSVSNDGMYVISAMSEDVVIHVTGQSNAEGETLSNQSGRCAVGARTDSHALAPMEQTAGGLIQVAGKVDPKAPNVLAGSKTEESSDGAGGKRVKTTTWQFRRQ
jgi:hypothetical protein